MNASICTLFEGNYHYGLAALINSLFKNGFKGNVYVGYRGALPEWTAGATDNREVEWKGVKTLVIDNVISVHFLPVETDFHFTNFKPTFMLQLIDGPAKNADALAYFDPDIFIKCNWQFYETWMSHGVALVHEISSNDMPPNHPIRREWEKLIKSLNKVTVRQLYSYINAGFCGVSKENFGFIKEWQQIINAALDKYQLSAKAFMFTTDRTDPFYCIDQDALNVTAMCSDSPTCEMGPESMDFIQGGQIMSHAVSQPKPWNKHYVMSAIKGISQTIPDKVYWKNVDGPVFPYSKSYLWRKKKSMLFASVISRFNRR